MFCFSFFINWVKPESSLPSYRPFWGHTWSCPSPWPTSCRSGPWSIYWTPSCSPCPCWRQWTKIGFSFLKRSFFLCQELHHKEVVHAVGEVVHDDSVQVVWVSLEAAVHWAAGPCGPVIAPGLVAFFLKYYKIFKKYEKRSRIKLTLMCA